LNGDSEGVVARRITEGIDDGADYNEPLDNLEYDDEEEPEEASLESRLIAIDERRQDERERRGRESSRLRDRVAWAAIILVGIQVVSSNIFFACHMAATLGRPNEPIMLAWMSSSVVEIIGVLGIVAHSLFPGNGKKPRQGK
jgi:hypothetical protein